MTTRPTRRQLLGDGLRALLLTSPAIGLSAACKSSSPGTGQPNGGAAFEGIGPVDVETLEGQISRLFGDWTWASDLELLPGALEELRQEMLDRGHVALADVVSQVGNRMVSPLMDLAEAVDAYPDDEAAFVARYQAALAEFTLAADDIHANADLIGSELDESNAAMQLAAHDRSPELEAIAGYEKDFRKEAHAEGLGDHALINGMLGLTHRHQSRDPEVDLDAVREATGRADDLDFLQGEYSPGTEDDPPPANAGNEYEGICKLVTGDFLWEIQDAHLAEDVDCNAVQDAYDAFNAIKDIIGATSGLVAAMTSLAAYGGGAGLAVALLILLLLAVSIFFALRKVCAVLTLADIVDRCLG